MAAKLDEWARDGKITRYTLWNKQNPLADPAQCGKYRVDFTSEMLTGVVLFEYDEQMHSDRVLRCELLRQAEVALGFGGLPVYWIRFNPDAFKVDGVTRVTKLAERNDVLLKQLQHALNNIDYDHHFTVTYICYTKKKQGDQDGASGRDSSSAIMDGSFDTDNDNLVQSHKFKTIEDYNKWVEAIS
jgi:hypothetical protein